MYYLLFIIYVIACCIFIGKNSFIKKAGIGNTIIVPLFLLKVATGVITGWMTVNRASDYWMFNKEGWNEYQLLITKPADFFSGILHSNYDSYNNYFGATGSYWNDLPTNIIVKFIAVLNLITRGNYYLNDIFFNLAGLFGCVALYRIFIHVYPAKRWTAIIGCFLLPSALIYTASIHKDVIVFTMTAFFCYGLYFSLEQKFTAKRITVIAISFVVVALLRSYIALLLFPTAIAWILSKRTAAGTARSFAFVYGCGILALGAIQLFRPQSTPLRFVVERQKAFFQLPVAHSQVKTDTLYPTAASFINNAPQALNHAFLRPYLFEFNSAAVQNFFALEILLYLCILIAMLFLYKRQDVSPFIIFSIVFTCSVFLFIGYIVPNTGSIVRYRGIFLPWLITPILCHIDFTKIKRSAKY